MSFTELHLGLISKDLRVLTESLLSSYAKMFEESSEEDRLHHLIQVISSIVRPVYYYYNAFAQRYVELILAMYKTHPK
jgi:hypothetical protein